jgi:hypothetical protein
MTYRCSCGFTAASLERFEDHLFTFPEDDHYELASGHQGLPGQNSELRGAGPVSAYRRRSPAAIQAGWAWWIRRGGFADVDD